MAKRAFEGDASGARQSQFARTSSYSDSARSFSAGVADQLASLYCGRTCWACSAPSNLDRAHVLSKRDDNLRTLQDVGLTSIRSHGDIANSFFLCKSCHAAYDNHYKPQLLIVPTHLDFFEVERNWQAACQPSNVITRIPPTAMAYLDCCAHLDPRPRHFVNSALGGSYTCYIDEGFFAPSDTREWCVRKHWHGDPMVMVRHAIQAVSKIAWPTRVPVAIFMQLKELSLLYDRGTCRWKQLREEQEEQEEQEAPLPPPPSQRDPASQFEKPPDALSDSRLNPSAPAGPSSGGSGPGTQSDFDSSTTRRHPQRLHTPPSSAPAPSPEAQKRRCEFEPNSDQLQRKRLCLDPPQATPVPIKHSGKIYASFRDVLRADTTCSEPALVRLSDGQLSLDPYNSLHLVRRWLGMAENPVGEYQGWAGSRAGSWNCSLSVRSRPKGHKDERDKGPRIWRFGPETTTEQAVQRSLLNYI